jgi:hypothetical protein
MHPIYLPAGASTKIKQQSCPLLAHGAWWGSSADQISNQNLEQSSARKGTLRWQGLEGHPIINERSLPQKLKASIDTT